VIETIFALSSGRPPAAISVIRITGPGAKAAGRALAGSVPDARTAAVRKLHDPVSGLLLDEALVLAFDGPRSATGEDCVELHCHGGRAIVDAVLAALESIEGLRPARPGEFTRRAFENGRIDLTEAEGLADLIEAETEAQRKAALAVAEGGVRRQIDSWRKGLLALSARAEAAIDYVDEGDVGCDPVLAANSQALADELAEWLERPRAEPLKDGIRVVVAGPPNAGKSSLINAIVGHERAIVSAVPGTTRDYVDVPLSLDGLPILLTDTAGLREAGEEVERSGIDRAHSLIAVAEVVVWLGAPGDAPAHPRLIQVHSKSDLKRAPKNALGVSSVTGAGIATLMRRVAECARAFLPGEGAIALNRRQAALIAEAEQRLREAATATDPVIAAEELRQARTSFDRLTGRAAVEDVLDALFGRFCLGK
jgi:tRNA modification GTPase